MGLFKKAEPKSKVKTFHTTTLKGLEKEINRFGKKHEILDVSQSDNGSGIGHYAVVRYKD